MLTNNMGLSGEVKIGKYFPIDMTTVFLAPLKGSPSIFGEQASAFANVDTDGGSSLEVEITIPKVKMCLLEDKWCVFTGRNVSGNHAFLSLPSHESLLCVQRNARHWWPRPCLDRECHLGKNSNSKNSV